MRLIIVDYGLSNILSVKRAFEYHQIDALVSSDPEIIAGADGMVLPGVGAFRDGMEKLCGLNLVPVIRDRIAMGVPILGICLGMQMLFNDSEEFGMHEGLGFIPGHVKAIPHESIDSRPQRIPNIGWNQLISNMNGGNASQDNCFEDKLLNKIPAKSECYFVHSYEAIPDNSEDVTAYTLYGGRKICAAVQRNNVFGTQFHPEKSGEVGLVIIKNYITIVGNKASIKVEL